ncbi:rod shape-determining protein MreD [Belnapia sp. T6]|uniref:Rod shape-determining protein MreD n=1 Tax=Belnapia mucosa TaxID=2804532 RepID=A0ABS1V6I3_9PROT|nr:rod shape-determining protein MreD [Belnapia mucosa]MBL6457284.1 rod shape-determining protein MreD [Belnapia mucosa]
MKGRPAPATGLLRRLDALGRAAFPTAAAALLMVLAAVPTGLPGLVPATALPCVFFWSVFRPATLPPPAVFGLGLLQDLLTFAPVGSGVLTLLVVGGLATRWRRFLIRHSFLAVWLAYCGMALGAAALGWLLQTVLGWRLLPTAPGLYEVLLTAGLYPCLAGFLTWMHLGMTEAEAAA